MIAIIIFIAIVFGVYYLYYAIKAKVKGISINKAINPNYKTEHEKQQIQKEDEEYRKASEERQHKYQELYSSKNAPKIRVSSQGNDEVNSSELLDNQQSKERNKQARKEAWNQLTAPKYKKPHYVRNTLLFGIFGTMHSSHRDKKNRR